MFIRKILVVGYYYRHNLGDDLFIETIPNFFKDSELVFKTSDDIYSTDLKTYNAIIFGGGDLINDFFRKVTKYARDNFSGPIFGFSLGIPYFETISKGYLDAFDHVFVRNKSYLIPLQHALGSQYVHYLPDSVMTCNSWSCLWKPGSNTIGTFFPSSIMKPKIMYRLCNSLKKLLDNYPETNLRLYCFDTEDSSDNHDLRINTEIAKFLTIHGYKDRFVNDSTRYTGSEMMQQIASLKMAICSRFHAHILSILTGTPFVSIHYTNKVELLMKEKGLDDCFCNMTIDSSARPIDFDESIFFDKIMYVMGGLETLHHKLINIRDHDRMLCHENYQIEYLIKTGKRRTIIPDPIFVDRVDMIYLKYKPLVEKSKDILTLDQSEKIAKSMLYEITDEISNAGVYGTSENLITKPQLLREMIDWVWKDSLIKDKSQPQFNLRTTSNRSFSGLHRSGWKFALDSIQSLHSDYGVILDPYCDATFGWCREYPCREFGIIPYTSPWCGFFHHTPSGVGSDNTIENSTSTIEFKQSLETCRGLFTLSEWLAEWLRKRLKDLGYPDVPVVSVYHPTGTFGIIPFRMPSEPEPKSEPIHIVNIGAWMRNTYSIYQLNLDPKIFRKYRLKGKFMDSYFPPEKLDLSYDAVFSENINNSFVHCMNMYIRNIVRKNSSDPDFLTLKVEKIIEEQLSSVTVLDQLSDSEYDLLLSKYIVFVDFIECSAANTVIECMARGNPIIVNRFPSVVEYLGSDYPLFFDDLDEIPGMLTRERIQLAFEHMQRPEIRSRISSEKFYHDIVNSSIVRAIAKNK